MADGITDEMVERAAEQIYGGPKHRYKAEDGGDLVEYTVAWNEVTEKLGIEERVIYLRQARRILEAALVGRAVIDLPSDRKWIEFCRACRNERDEIVPADFILWGKLLPSEQLGPRCYNHATAYIGVLAMTRIDQWAVFDLRPLNRALTQSTEAAGGVL